MEPRSLFCFLFIFKTTDSSTIWQNHTDSALSALSQAPSPTPSLPFRVTKLQLNSQGRSPVPCQSLPLPPWHMGPGRMSFVDTEGYWSWDPRSGIVTSGSRPCRCASSLLSNSHFSFAPTPPHPTRTFPGLSWSMQDLCCVLQALSLWHRVSSCSGLSCSEACWILTPWPGIKPASPALGGGFLTTGPAGKSWLWPL